MRSFKIFCSCFFNMICDSSWLWSGACFRFRWRCGCNNRRVAGGCIRRTFTAPSLCHSPKMKIVRSSSAVYNIAGVSNITCKMGAKLQLNLGQVRSIQQLELGMLRKQSTDKIRSIQQLELETLRKQSTDKIRSIQQLELGMLRKQSTKKIRSIQQLELGMLRKQSTDTCDK